MKHIPDTTISKKKSTVYDISVRIRKVGGMTDRYYLQYKWGFFGLWHNVAEYWNYHAPWEEIWVFDNLEMPEQWQMRIIKNPGLIEQIEHGNLIDPDVAPTMEPDKPYNWEGVKLAFQFVITLGLLMLGPRYNDDGEYVSYYLQTIFHTIPLVRFIYTVIVVASLLYIIIKILPDEENNRLDLQ